MLAVWWVLLIVPTQESRQLMHGSDAHVHAIQPVKYDQLVVRSTDYHNIQ
jgi:hypothetical protein